MKNLTFKQKIISAILVILGVTGGGYATLGSISSQKCTVSSTSVAAVGNAVSSTILAANETRAYARIQNLVNATNTVYLSFDEGAAAVSTSSVALSTSTTGNTMIELGRHTPFPYTGAVTGLASAGTTTVRVIECSY